jgi:hypothetical protein
MIKETYEKKPGKGNIYTGLPKKRTRKRINKKLRKSKNGKSTVNLKQNL